MNTLQLLLNRRDGSVRCYEREDHAQWGDIADIVALLTWADGDADAFEQAVFTVRDECGDYFFGAWHEDADPEPDAQVEVNWRRGDPLIAVFVPRFHRRSSVALTAPYTSSTLAGDGLARNLDLAGAQAMATEFAPDRPIDPEHPLDALGRMVMRDDPAADARPGASPA